MDPRHRDGLLAVGVGVVVVAIAVRHGVTATTTDPILLGAGAVVVLGVELLLAWHPARSAAVWDRQPVRILATLLVIAAGGAAAVVAPWLLGVLVGGLLGYLLLLALVLAGVVPGAESWFDR